MEQNLSSLVKDAKHPTQDEIQSVSDMLEAEGRKGVWILGPKTLGLDTDGEADIYGWDFYDFATRGLRYARTSGAAVVTRVESRETFATLIAQPKEPAAAGPSKAPVEIPEGDNLITFQFGLRDRFPELPWRSGTYLIDVAMDGAMSNRLEMSITPGKAAERDPAIAAYIEQQKGRSAGQLDFYPAQAAPATDGSEAPRSALEIPWVDEITLKADRVSVYKPGAHNMLQGSFRLKLPAGFYRNAEGGGPTATVPITLVITGNDMVGPFVAPLRVPTFDRIDKDAAETEVTGRFAVDLFALSETSKVVQTYTIWAYSGVVRSEPVLNAIITPDMLH